MTRGPRTSVPALTVLGGFELSVGGAAVPLQRSAQRLVAFLALQARPLQRAFVAGSLWLDMPERRATASLRTALWRTNSGRRAIVVTSATHVGLEPAVAVDLRHTTQLARSIIDGRANGRQPAPDAVATLMRAPDELLPDWYEDWVVVERERYRQLRLHALEALSFELAAHGDFSRAVEAGVAAVAIEPLRESAHRALMNAHLEEGNAVEAIRQYRSFTRLLRAQLGIDPSAHIRALADRAVGAGRPR
jgi:DNA-binding SARP family transcriptional activator